MSDYKQVVKSPPFSKSFWEVERCGDIEKVIDSKVVSYGKWTSATATLYTKLLSMYEYNKGQTYPLTLSYKRLAGYCNLSESVVSRHIRDLSSFGIVEFTNKRLYNGTLSANTYTKVVNIVSDPRFKIIPNKHYMNYQKEIKERKARIKLLCTELPQTAHEWTREEIKNYTRNNNFELNTGLFLKGDKKAGLLFPLLKEYEIFRDDITPHELEEILQEVKLNNMNN